MTILALDPGTHCGWCLRHDRDRLDSGVFDLKPRRFEGGGMRWVYLRRFLRPLLTDPVPSLVVFEEVRRHMGVDAAHIYGGIIAVIQEECEAAGIPYTALPVATVKKFATGRGGANKEAMMAAAKARWGVPFEDDNEADARWIAECAAAQAEAA